MEQVVANLLSNAIKYGEGKPVRVRVSGGGSGAVLEVEDGGIGVPERDHRRVFEPFERAAPNHRRNSLGLGLHIVRTFVEAHGGTVRLRSDVGKGSTFTVELPRQPHGPGADGDGQVLGTDDGQAARP
jgi:signal transduction histidine kinase